MSSRAAAAERGAARPHPSTPRIQRSRGAAGDSPAAPAWPARRPYGPSRPRRDADGTRPRPRLGLRLARHRPVTSSCSSQPACSFATMRRTRFRPASRSSSGCSCGPPLTADRAGVVLYVVDDELARVLLEEARDHARSSEGVEHPQLLPACTAQDGLDCGANRIKKGALVAYVGDQLAREVPRVLLGDPKRQLAVGARFEQVWLALRGTLQVEEAGIACWDGELRRRQHGQCHCGRPGQTGLTSAHQPCHLGGRRALTFKRSSLGTPSPLVAALGYRPLCSSRLALLSIPPLSPPSGGLFSVSQESRSTIASSGHSISLSFS